jgi:cellobiose-specific phosphotransferase system component IIA
MDVERLKRDLAKAVDNVEQKKKVAKIERESATAKLKELKKKLGDAHKREEKLFEDKAKEVKRKREALREEAERELKQEAGVVDKKPRV